MSEYKEVEKGARGERKRMRYRVGKRRWENRRKERWWKERIVKEEEIRRKYEG